MVDDVLDLELVLVVGVVFSQVTEFLNSDVNRELGPERVGGYLSQLKAVVGQFWADEILRDLDTVVQISHLKREVD